MLYQDAISAGGSLERLASSTHVVSAWYLPGGYDAVNAEEVTYFFDDKEAADKVASKYPDPPELAMTLSLAAIDKLEGIAP